MQARQHDDLWYDAGLRPRQSCKSVDVSNFHLRQAAAVIAFFCCVISIIIIILIIRLSNWDDAECGKRGVGSEKERAEYTGKLLRLCFMLYLSNVYESTAVWETEGIIMTEQ